MLYRIDSGNPNGQVQAAPPALCYTTQGGLWVKINSSADSIGWLCLLEQSPFFTDMHLMFDSATSGDNPPTHTPQIDFQSYTDKTNHVVWQWYDGQWH